MKNLLIESTPVTLQLVEGVASGKTIARGEFGRVDVPTQNGRIYPQRLIEREIQRLSEDLKARRVVGELDHPSDGKTSLKRVSHVITSLTIKDGVVIGEAEILDTHEGKNLKALIAANVQVGVSSRGYGSTAPSRGKFEGEEVQEDFVLKTYDFVADPAMKSAVPGIYTEDVDDETVADLFLREFPDVAESIRNASAAPIVEAKDAPVPADEARIRADLTEKFERQLKDAILAMREDVTSQIREELSSDPEVGGAKSVLATIAEMVSVYRSEPGENAVRDAMKAKELEVASAIRERDEALEMGQMAAHALLVERRVSGHPMAESVRKLMAGRKFGCVAEAESALDAIMAQLPETVSKEEAAYRVENAALKGEKALLESKVAELNDKVARVVKLGERIEEQRIQAEEAAMARVTEAEEKAMEAQRLMEESTRNVGAEVETLRAKLEESELRAYKLQKVAGLPNGRELMGLMESVSDKAVVDQLVERRAAVEIGDPELRRMRHSLESKRGLTGPTQRLEEDHSNGGVRSNDIFGSSMAEIALLAGISAK